MLPKEAGVRIPAADCNGCARIMVEVWGGGGGGGGGCGSPGMGGGGGGGGYGKSVFVIESSSRIRVISARDMTEKEKRYYKKRKGMK